MARDHARVNVTIWGDPDFRALPAPAQHLYFTLWTAPKLSYCGVHDWRPGRLAARSSGLSVDDMEAIAQCLEARHFLVIDRDTEECLIRSWARYDGLMKQPRMAVSYAKAYADVESPIVAQVLAYELGKIHNESPGLACWSDRRVGEILEHPATSAKDLPKVSDPFGDGFALHFGQRLAQTRDGVWGLPTPAPTPSPTPYSPQTCAPADADDATGDESFEAFWDAYDNKKDRKRAEQKYRLALKKRGVTPELLITAATAYVKSQRAKGKHPEYTKKADTWLNGECWNDEAEQAPTAKRPPHVSQLHASPPPGLSPEESDQWAWGQHPLQLKGQ